MDEAYIDKWMSDFDHISDYETMTELSEIEQIGVEQRQESKTLMASTWKNKGNINSAVH